MRTVLAIALLLGVITSNAQEPPFPQRGPLEITVLFPAGSSADVTAGFWPTGYRATSGSACWW